MHTCAPLERSWRRPGNPIANLGAEISVVATNRVSREGARFSGLVAEAFFSGHLIAKAWGRPCMFSVGFSAGLGSFHRSVCVLACIWGILHQDRHVGGRGRYV